MPPVSDGMPGRRLPIVEPERQPAAKPIFEKVAIAGLGLIGGSLALAVRKAWPASLIIGFDAKDVLEEAIRRHAVDVGADDPVVMAEADLVVLAAPVGANLELIDVVSEHVRTSAVVTDVGATKRAIVRRARALPSRFRFVGGHPLAGAARQGIAHAQDDLFVGRPWLLTPTGEAAGQAVERLTEFVTGVGARPHTMTPDEHDRVVGAIGHLPQLAATALMQVVGTRAQDDGLALAGRGLVDTTRLASSPRVGLDGCLPNECRCPRRGSG